ncbi:MAG: hypothetical protein ACFFBP_01150 [Promethearchaeota archaeon]
MNYLRFLSSQDPVALDQACVDLVYKYSMNPHSALGDIKLLEINENECFSYTPRFDPDTGKYENNLNAKNFKHWELQMKIAKELGLGTRKYNLIEDKIEKEG